MSLVWHLFRTEARLSKPLLLPLIGLHIVQLGVMLGWFGSPAPKFPDDNVFLVAALSFVWMGRAMFELLFLISVLNFNNPSRFETIAATRPIPLRELVGAKLLLLFLVLVLPHVISELILLLGVGSSAGELWLGVFQRFVGVSVFVALVTALAWMWRSKKETIWAYVSGFLVFTATMAMGVLIVHYFWGQNSGNAAQIRLETAFTPMRVLGGMAVAAVLFWILVLFQWKAWWSFGRRLSVSSLILVITISGIWFGSRKGIDAEPMEVPLLVGASMRGPRVQNDREEYALRIRPGAEMLGNEFDVKWGVQDVVIDGRELPMLSPADPGRHPRKVDVMDWWGIRGNGGCP